MRLSLETASGRASPDCSSAERSEALESDQHLAGNDVGRVLREAAAFMGLATSMCCDAHSGRTFPAFTISAHRVTSDVTNAWDCAGVLPLT